MAMNGYGWLDGWMAVVGKISKDLNELHPRGLESWWKNT